MGQFLGAARGIPDFAIYIFSGLTIYALFSETLTGSTASIMANSGLVKKVYVPREIFPLSTIGSALFTFAVQLAVLILACFILGRSEEHTSELQSLMRISYAVFCLKKKKTQ